MAICVNQTAYLSDRNVALGTQRTGPNEVVISFADGESAIHVKMTKAQAEKLRDNLNYSLNPPARRQ